MAETEATGEAETSAAAAPSEPSIRLWRTAFLTLRDEALTSPPPPTVIQLLNRLIFSQSDVLLAAAPDLPSHEVTSDVMFLMDLARNTISDSRRGQGGFTTNDFVHCFTQFAHFIHAVSTRIPLKMSSTSWGHMLDSFREVVKMLCGKGEMKPLSIGDVSRARAIKQCLETIRYLFGVYQRSSMLSENKQLLEFLLSVLACSQDESIYSYSTCKQRMSVNNSLWDIQALAFTMIGDIYSRVGSSLPVDIWHSTIEVLRKVMDGLASKCMLVEDSVMARFYTSVLQCLHLVLVDPKGSLSGHVASLVAALRMFFQYGLINRSHVVFPFGDRKKEIGSFRTDTNRLDSKKSKSGPYRPPHLRKKDSKDLRPRNEDSLSSSENESSTVLHISSDSDYSDSDGSLRDACNVHYAKTRLAAIVCLQDLCRADPKSFTAYWTMLLPSSDVLQPRKYDTTLMSCLLFDPYIKARIASASTITAMLDGPASIFLQVAEYKESTKCGSFTALSSSLGQILVQLHSGILYLIKHETNGGLLASLFKILMLLTSSTPYSRMPAELLPTAVASVKARIEEGFPSRSDNTSLMAAAINCLTIALSASPSSVHVKNMLSVEVSKGISGSLETQLKSGVLPTLIQFSEPVTNPSISLEALKALKAVAHNYPSTMVSCWEQVSSVIYGFLSFPSEPQAISWRANAGNAFGAMGERVTTAAVKVLDESLRAISGFKGTEDLSDEKLLDDPFTSDCVKTKSISSAPYYGSERPSQTVDELKASPSGSEQWSEAITKHIPLGLQHSSGVVRAASVTCFAGITSSVFFSLPKEEQNVILNSSIKAALRDEVPSVRSAACRALGIIACFPLIFQSVKILDQFITAIGHNTSDSQISVRIVASWALANICDSLRHCITADTFKKDKASSQLISLLIDSAFRLAEDNDKIKANAVRALGNLSRFVPYTSESLLNDEERDCTGSPLASSGANNMSTSGMHRDNSSSFQQPSVKDSLCLEKMVQVFLSCVTTGNVKVQWNVCHALSNLFCNKTLKLQDASWAPSVFSILLLLLRDSSNFKIRIQAAAALAVPATVNDYRRSFYDVLKGVEHIIENSGSDLVLSPSNFKYKVALEKQLTSTLLHVLGLASRTNSQAVQDFLVKKASFLEEWLKELRLSLEDRTAQVEAEDDMLLNQKKDVISRAIHSLVEVYEGSNHHAIAQKFDKLAESIL